MRWIASLVAEAYRILIRGGVFLYPGDQRPGYGQGRLRLVYEANPIAMLIEQAGGARHRHGRAASSTSSRAACTSACRWCSARPGKSSASPATTPTPADRRARAAVRQSRPVPRLREPDHVGQASHHLDHRLVRRGHHLGQAHLRADLPPREGRGRLHRGRRLPPLRPRRHEGQGRRGGAEGQPELHPFPRRGQRARHACRRCSRNMAARAAAGRAPTSTTKRRRSASARRPAPSPTGASSRRATCSSTRACTAAR